MSIFVQTQGAPVPVPHPARKTPVVVSLRGVSARKFHELGKNVEQKYLNFAKHATEFFGAEMAGLVCSLVKCAYMRELSVLNTRDTAASLEVLQSTAELYENVEEFLQKFLRTQPFLPPALSPEHIRTFLRSEGWHSENTIQNGEAA